MQLDMAWKEPHQSDEPCFLLRSYNSLCLETTQSNNQLTSWALMQCRAPALHLANARMLMTPSKSYTSSSKNLYANLKSAFRRFILLLHFIISMVRSSTHRGAKYAVKRYGDKETRLLD